jgi:hypothetical protein
MRGSKALGAAVVLLFGCFQFSAAAQQNPATLQVSGGLERVSGRQGFRLDVSYSAESSPHGKALLVYAEPSHSLLLAHVDPDLDLADYREALALTRGSASRARHSLSLAYHPFADRRIVVVLKDGSGREQVIADATVNLRSFDFSTSFEGDPIASAVYHHCCRGPRCAQMCVDCDTPEFTCDLIECDIQCGSGGASWPPKV